MAQKPTTTTKSLDSQVAKELEEALDFNLTSDGDLDMAASIEDLEAQISQAADELARESAKTTKPASTAAVAPPAPKPQNGVRTMAQPANEWRPAGNGNGNGDAPLQPGGHSPANANDDRQRDLRAFRRAMNKRSSSGIYWMVLLLSIA